MHKLAAFSGNGQVTMQYFKVTCPILYPEQAITRSPMMLKISALYLFGKLKIEKDQREEMRIDLYTA